VIGCAAKIFAGYHRYPCGNKASTERGYCGVHDPEAVKSRDVANREKRMAKSEARDKRREEAHAAAFLREVERRAGASIQEIRQDADMDKCESSRWLRRILGEAKP
jgi:hypothetical protein